MRYGVLLVVLGVILSSGVVVAEPTDVGFLKRYVKIPGNIRRQLIVRTATKYPQLTRIDRHSHPLLHILNVRCPTRSNHYTTRAIASRPIDSRKILLSG